MVIEHAPSCVPFDAIPHSIIVYRSLVAHPILLDAGEACPIVLHGSPNQIVNEGERSPHDALPVLSQAVSGPSHSWWWRLQDADEPCCGQDSEKC